MWTSFYCALAYGTVCLTAYALWVREQVRELKPAKTRMHDDEIQG